eukprot:scaffold25556_cov144-Skeletonema_dohrnii-CCMP3373.AAC.1
MYCDEVKHIQQVESHMVGGNLGGFLLRSDDNNLSTLPTKCRSHNSGGKSAASRVGTSFILGMCSLPLIGNNSDTPALAACVRCG